MARVSSLFKTFYLWIFLSIVSCRRNRPPLKRIPLNSDIFDKTLSLFVEKRVETSASKYVQSPIITNKPFWIVTILGDTDERYLDLPTYYPEVVLSLLLQMRVNYDDVMSTSSTNFDFSISNNNLLEKEVTTIRSDKLTKLLNKYKLRLSLMSGKTHSQSSFLLPGSLNYHRPVGTRVQFNRCEGRVGSYAGAFLVARNIFLKADYGIEINLDFIKSSQNMIMDIQKLRTLESASFRTFDAADSFMMATADSSSGRLLRSQRATYLKTSDVLDFYVNHFSGWSHWYMSHQATSDPLLQLPDDDATVTIMNRKNEKARLSVQNKSHKERYNKEMTLKLSQLMEQECSVFRSRSNSSASTGMLDDERGGGVIDAVALIPFWGGSVSQSGGNAHYEAPTLNTKLQQISGSICSALKYFNRIVVGVCEKDKSVDSLERKLKHQWSLNVARIKASSLINLFHKNDGGDDRDNANCGIKSQAPVQVIFLEFSCHVGVQLPFFLLTTVQAILKQVEAEPDDDFKHTILTSQPTNRNRCSAFFKNVNLIYYTEADQVTMFRNMEVLHSISSVIRHNNEAIDDVYKTSRKKKKTLISSSHRPQEQQSYVISPQRITMRFTESHSIELKRDKRSEEEEETTIHDDGRPLSEVVNQLLSLSNNGSAIPLAMSNTCIKCPLCASSSTSSSDAASSIKLTTDPTLIDSSRLNNEGGGAYAVYIHDQIVRFNTKVEAQRHWLIRQGFNPRDERKWPSAQPSKSPTIKPSIMPTSLSPTHLPTMSVTPRPTLSPGPTHPFIWIGRLILISVLLFALVVKYRNDILQYRGE